MKKTKTPSRPLFVRAICWVLVILMVGSAAYTTIWGISELISSLLAG